MSKRDVIMEIGTSPDEMIDARSRIISSAASRGLWIGLRVAHSATHDLLKLQVEDLNPDVVTRSADDHVTLAHLGKSNDTRVVDACLASIQTIVPMQCITQVGVEALAHFWTNVVAIVVPDWIDAVATQMDDCLRDRHVFPDRKYAGIRHVTIGQIKRGVKEIRTTCIERYKLELDALTLNCGDDSLIFKLPQTPDHPF